MKKVISLFLVMALLTAMLAVSFNALSVSDEGYISAKEAIAAYEAETGEEVEVHRVYFQMPNGSRGTVADADVSVHRTVYNDEGEIIDEYDEVVLHAGEKALTWYNDYNVQNGKNYAGIYWWGGTAHCESSYGTGWAGYRMEIADYDQGIYYVDLPSDIVTASFNNAVDGGTDPAEDIYDKAAQSVDINMEGAWEGDYDTLPYGSPEQDWFGDCIYVIDPNQMSINALSNRQTCGGNWYVYYGNGCYGSYFDGCDEYVSPEENCLNPDHMKNGVHVGYQGDDDPTEPAPTEPAPTQAPTEAPTEPNFIGDPTKLYFDAKTTGWEMGAKDKIGFFAFPLSPDVPSNYTGWGGRRLQGSDPDGDGIWEYDATPFLLEDGVQYKIIFAHVVNNAFTDQTYDLFFDTTCLGDVAFCDGTEYENPADSSKKTLAAFWKNKDASEYGPVLQISSIGNVIGTCPEQGKTTLDVFLNFISVVNSETGKTGLDNARVYVVDVGIKTEQKLIDDIGLALGLTKQEVYGAFTNNDVESTWDYKVSVLPGEVVIPTEPEPPVPTEKPTEAPATEPVVKGILGDIDGSGEVDVVDVTVIQRVDAGIKTADAIMKVLGDVNGIGGVNVIDATLVQRWLVGLNDNYGIGQPI